MRERKKSKNETRPPVFLLMQTRLPEIGLQHDEKDDPKGLYNSWVKKKLCSINIRREYSRGGK